MFIAIRSHFKSNSVFSFIQNYCLLLSTWRSDVWRDVIAIDLGVSSKGKRDILFKLASSFWIWCGYTDGSCIQLNGFEYTLGITQTENGIQLTLNHGIKAKSALGETIKLEIKFLQTSFCLICTYQHIKWEKENT